MDTVPDLDPKPEPRLFQSRNRNRVTGTPINHYGSTTHTVPYRLSPDSKLTASKKPQKDTCNDELACN